MADKPLKYGTKGIYIGGTACPCGKVSWDKKGAQTKRNSLLSRGNERELRIYACPISNRWHITKT